MIRWRKIVETLCTALENSCREIVREREKNEKLEKRLRLYKATAGRDYLATNEMLVLVEQGGYLPESAHDQDAGYDLRTPEPFIVPAGGSRKIDTKVHVKIPDGYAGVLISKSGLNIKRDLTSTGLIDAGYTGSIVVKLYNHGQGHAAFDAGEKISQLMIVPIAKPALHQVATLEELGTSERGANGFGSTGR